MLGGIRNRPLREVCEELQAFNLGADPRARPLPECAKVLCENRHREVPEFGKCLGKQAESISFLYLRGNS